jgi:hypothetical protein
MMKPKRSKHVGTRAGVLSLGEICCSRKQRQHAFRWLGVVIVEVTITTFPRDGEGGKLPVCDKRTRRRRRSHRRGVRTSRVARSTALKASSEVDNLAPRRTGPAPSTAAKARNRFVDWVDRAVNRIRHRLISEIDMRAWYRWESQDFHPTMVPWTRYDSRLRFFTRRDGTCIEREIWKQRRRAWDLRCELIRQLTEKKGRSPPPGYVENALAIKSRTWKSAGVVLYEEGQLSFEYNREMDGLMPKEFEDGYGERRCAWCGRSCVASLLASSNQVRCPQGSGCRVWQTRQGKPRKRVAKASRRR